MHPSFAKEYFQLLADLLVLGGMTERRSVVPPVDCASPWITKNKRAREGIEQVRCCRALSLSLQCTCPSLESLSRSCTLLFHPFDCLGAFFTGWLNICLQEQ